jgi:hypothetical protein
MAAGVRALQDAGELDEDAFGLVVKRSELLGFTEFSGDRHAIEHWGHCDAGGTWTQDGEEHLLAWLQADVRTGGGGRPARDGRRLLPIAATLAVLDDVLEHIGVVALAEADAIVPLAFMADPISRLASGRDWLTRTPDAGPPHDVIITLEAGGSSSKLAPDRLAEGMACVGEELLGPIAVQPAQDRPRDFLHRRFTRGAAELRGATSCWSVDLAAWAIELTARACLVLGVRESVLIAVRRGEPVAPRAAAAS